MIWRTTAFAPQSIIASLEIDTRDFGDRYFETNLAPKDIGGKAIEVLRDEQATIVSFLFLQVLLPIAGDFWKENERKNEHE